jgi:putative pyruvate formate lyase activating enzyme
MGQSFKSGANLQKFLNSKSRFGTIRLGPIVPNLFHNLACMEPAYLRLHNQGVLKERAEALLHELKDCTLCPRNCHADRLSGDLGTCSTGEFAMVSSYMPHFGEESPISGNHGSGTIFFTHCNLLCNFCQNFDISHEGRGSEVSARELADMMLSLQALGCHNINFVTPSHVVPQILQALIQAIEDGLRIPLVYNSGGYDKVSTLKLLDGIIDIYMPDFKFWDSNIANETCNAPDYPDIARRSVTEMYRQVGDLEVNTTGIAERGLLIRHLVMPEGVAGTRKIMDFLSTKISPKTYVNIMPQYRPCGKAWDYPIFKRPIEMDEYQDAITDAKSAGLTRFDQR